MNLETQVQHQLDDVTKDTKKLYSRVFDNAAAVKELNKHVIDIGIRSVAMGRKSRETYSKLQSKYYAMTIYAAIVFIIILLCIFVFGN